MAITEKNNCCVVRREVRKKFSSRAEAERYEKLLGRALENADWDFGLGLSGCPTILEALPVFLGDRQCFNGVAERTVEKYRKVLTRLARELSRGAGDIAVDKIVYDDLADWISARFAQKGNAGKYVESGTLAAGTVANDIKKLKRFARWCGKRRYCSLDIDVMRMDPVRVPGRTRRHNRFPPRGLHARDFGAVLKRLQGVAERVELVLRAMVLFGARPAAVFAINKSDYVAPSARYDGEVRLAALKGGQPSVVRIKNNSQLHKFVDVVVAHAEGIYASRGWRLSPNKPLFPNAHGRRWTTIAYDKALSVAAEKAGLGERFTAYQARHSAITWLIRNGAKPSVVRHYAKHLVVSTQEAYDWTVGEEAAGAYEAAAREFGRVPEKDLAAEREKVAQSFAGFYFRD